MPSEQVLDLFNALVKLQKVIKDEGAKEVLDDIYSYYPELYVALEKEFHHRQKIKELGVLLVGTV